MAPTHLLDDWRALEAVVAMPDLTASAKLVYFRLLSHRNRRTGKCNPSQATLAKGATISKRKAMDAVAELEAKGLLSVATRGGGDPRAPHGHVSSSYALFYPTSGEEISTGTGEEIDTGGGEEISTRGHAVTRTDPSEKFDTPRGEEINTQTIEREPTKKNRRKENHHIGPKADDVSSAKNWAPSDDEVPF